jgi:urease accessory protein
MAVMGMRRGRPAGITMSDHLCPFPMLALMRLQSWLSPAFPIGSYCYSHGLEAAVEAGDIRDRRSLVDWLDADLRYGAGRNEAIFFREASRCTMLDDRATLLDLAELGAAFRGTAEFALESSQQAAACLATLGRVWPDRVLDWLAAELSERRIRPVLSIILGIRSAREGLPATVALPAFLLSYVGNLVTAGIRLIPLGQTDGQVAIAELEGTVVAAGAEAENSTMDDLGSASFMVDLASTAHETQYTRLFRS